MATDERDVVTRAEACVRFMLHGMSRDLFAYHVREGRLPPPAEPGQPDRQRPGYREPRYDWAEVVRSFAATSRRPHASVQEALAQLGGDSERQEVAS